MPPGRSSLLGTDSSSIQVSRDETNFKLTADDDAGATPSKWNVGNDAAVESSPEKPVKISPVNSVRSNQMSIVSLNDDDVDSSSIADSDSDADHVPSRSEFMAGALAAQRHHQNVTTTAAGNGIIVINNGANGDGLLMASESSRPHIGSIALQNSTDITFGDKKYFQAPVTIKKYYLDKDKWVQRDAAETSGADNLAFVRSNGDMGEHPF